MYSAKAIRIRDFGIIVDSIVWIVDAGDCPHIKADRRIHEDVARNRYKIANLEIDETRAIDSETMEIISIK